MPDKRIDVDALTALSEIPPPLQVRAGLIDGRTLLAVHDGRTWQRASAAPRSRHSPVLLHAGWSSPRGRWWSWRPRYRRQWMVFGCTPQVASLVVHSAGRDIPVALHQVAGLAVGVLTPGRLMWRAHLAVRDRAGELLTRMPVPGTRWLPWRRPGIPRRFATYVPGRSH